MMRILFVSDHYPPLQLGGYEIVCRDVAKMMSARGHVIRVLTSSFRRRSAPPQEGVARSLPVRTERLLPLFWQEAIARVRTERAIRAFRPDVISVWNAGHLPWSTVVTAEASGVPVTYYLQDYWLLYTRNVGWLGVWTSPTTDPRLRRLRSLSRYSGLARIVWRVAPWVPIAPPAGRLAFVSRATRDEHATADLDVASSTIIPNGVDLGRIRRRPDRDGSGPLRLLYAGALIERKGVHTCIEAMASLLRPGIDANVQLTIIGDTPGGVPHAELDYGARLRRLAAERGAASVIDFRGPMAREDLLGEYANHDVLVFPSLWKDPFGLVPIEAMAAGLAVVATGVGGTAEYLVDGENCLLFLPGDAQALRRQVQRLFEAGFRARLAAQGREMVHRTLSIERQTDTFERWLLDAVRRSAADPHGRLSAACE
jgi:glycogen(starch) synthase